MWVAKIMAYSGTCTHIYFFISTTLHASKCRCACLVCRKVTGPKPDLSDCLPYDCAMFASQQPSDWGGVWLHCREMGMIYVHTSLKAKGSLIPRSLPDLILQPWIKISFLHGCEMKSGSCLETRLSKRLKSVNLSFVTTSSDVNLQRYASPQCLTSGSLIQYYCD